MICAKYIPMVRWPMYMIGMCGVIFAHSPGAIKSRPFFAQVRLQKKDPPSEIPRCVHDLNPLGHGISFLFEALSDAGASADGTRYIVSV